MKAVENNENKEYGLIWNGINDWKKPKFSFGNAFNVIDLESGEVIGTYKQSSNPGEGYKDPVYDDVEFYHIVKFTKQVDDRFEAGKEYTFPVEEDGFHYGGGYDYNLLHLLRIYIENKDYSSSKGNLAESIHVVYDECEDEFLVSFKYNIPEYKDGEFESGFFSKISGYELGVIVDEEYESYKEDGTEYGHIGGFIYDRKFEECVDYKQVLEALVKEYEEVNQY